VSEDDMRTFAIAFAAVLLAGASFAQEQEIKLKPGTGLEKVEGNCAACHTLAYIPMNSPFLDAKGWEAEVAKMIKAYRAPIDAADAKAITEYLKSNYGS
jgi:mono/diheme cytochrome c family protein